MMMMIVFLLLLLPLRTKTAIVRSRLAAYEAITGAWVFAIAGH